MENNLERIHDKDPAEVVLLQALEARAAAELVGIIERGEAQKAQEEAEIAEVERWHRNWRHNHPHGNAY